jgi:hypothetical protein
MGHVANNNPGSLYVGAALGPSAISQVLASIAVLCLLFGMAHGAAPVALGFCYDGNARFQEDAYRAHIQDFVPDSWESSMVAAVNQWNGTSRLYLEPTINSTQYWNFNIDTRDFVFAGWADNPGKTLMYGVDFFTQRWNRADAMLNVTYTWNTNGTFNQAQKKADVRTVTLHEVGHAIGLRHPIDCGQPYDAAEQNAAMHFSWSYKWSTRADDDAGNRFLYP